MRFCLSFCFSPSINLCDNYHHSWVTKIFNDKTVGTKGLQWGWTTSVCVYDIQNTLPPRVLLLSLSPLQMCNREWVAQYTPFPWSQVPDAVCVQVTWYFSTVAVLQTKGSLCHSVAYNLGQCEMFQERASNHSKIFVHLAVHRLDITLGWCCSQTPPSSLPLYQSLTHASPPNALSLLGIGVGLQCPNFTLHFLLRFVATFALLLGLQEA